MDYRYAIEPISAEDFADLLSRSGLASRRPVDDLPRLQRMLDNANLIVSARTTQTNDLVGIARSLTDWSYATYISDLAVDREHQGKGIGKRLIAETQTFAGKEAMLLLVSAPDAEAYYEKIGMPRTDRAFLFPREG